MSRAAILAAILSCAACGASSPTGPSAPPPAASSTTTTIPAPVLPSTIQVAPCPTVGPPDLPFFTQIGCNAFDGPLQPVRRWTIAPSLYLRTVDEAGAPIDAVTLDTVQAAMIEIAPVWTAHHFGLVGVLRGADTRDGVPGWITVHWPTTAGPSCGRADVAVNGGTIELNYKVAACGCNGSAMRARTARHELGHALGYWHTDNAADLMSGIGVAGCDAQPSARELAAAAYAYR